MRTASQASTTMPHDIAITSKRRKTAPIASPESGAGTIRKTMGAAQGPLVLPLPGGLAAPAGRATRRSLVFHFGRRETLADDVDQNTLPSSVPRSGQHDRRRDTNGRVGVAHHRADPPERGRRRGA